MTPAFLDGVLDAAGIQPSKLVLSLANNHILDQGIEGFDETVSALAERGIRTVGTVADGLVRRHRGGAADDRTACLHAMAQRRSRGVRRARDDARRHRGLARAGAESRSAMRGAALGFRVPAFSAGRERGRWRGRLAEEGAGLIVGRSCACRAAGGADRRHACRLRAWRFPRHRLAANTLAAADRGDAVGRGQR